MLTIQLLLVDLRYLILISRQNHPLSFSTVIMMEIDNLSLSWIFLHHSLLTRIDDYHLPRCPHIKQRPMDRQLVDPLMDIQDINCRGTSCTPYLFIRL